MPPSTRSITNSAATNNSSSTQSSTINGTHIDTVSSTHMIGTTRAPTDSHPPQITVPPPSSRGMRMVLSQSAGTGMNLQQTQAVSTVLPAVQNFGVVCSDSTPPTLPILTRETLQRIHNSTDTIQLNARAAQSIGLRMQDTNTTTQKLRRPQPPASHVKNHSWYEAQWPHNITNAELKIKYADFIPLLCYVQEELSQCLVALANGETDSLDEQTLLNSGFYSSIAAPDATSSLLNLELTEAGGEEIANPVVEHERKLAAIAEKAAKKGVKEALRGKSGQNHQHVQNLSDLSDNSINTKNGSEVTDSIKTTHSPHCTLQMLDSDDDNNNDDNDQPDFDHPTIHSESSDFYESDENWDSEESDHDSEGTNSLNDPSDDVETLIDVKPQRKYPNCDTTVKNAPVKPKKEKKAKDTYFTKKGPSLPPTKPELHKSLHSTPKKCTNLSEVLKWRSDFGLQTRLYDLLNCLVTKCRMKSDDEIYPLLYGYFTGIYTKKPYWLDIEENEKSKNEGAMDDADMTRSTDNSHLILNGFIVKRPITQFTLFDLCHELFFLFYEQLKFFYIGFYTSHSNLSTLGGSTSAQVASSNHMLTTVSIRTNPTSKRAMLFRKRLEEQQQLQADIIKSSISRIQHNVANFNAHVTGFDKYNNTNILNALNQLEHHRKAIEIINEKSISTIKSNTGLNGDGSENDEDMASLFGIDNDRIFSDENSLPTIQDFSPTPQQHHPLLDNTTLAHVPAQQHPLLYTIGGTNAQTAHPTILANTIINASTNYQFGLIPRWKSLQIKFSVDYLLPQFIEHFYKVNKIAPHLPVLAYTTHSVLKSLRLLYHILFIPQYNSFNQDNNRFELIIKNQIDYLLFNSTNNINFNISKNDLKDPQQPQDSPSLLLPHQTPTSTCLNRGEYTVTIQFDQVNNIFPQTDINLIKSGAFLNNSQQTLNPENLAPEPSTQPLSLSQTVRVVHLEPERNDVLLRYSSRGKSSYIDTKFDNDYDVDPMQYRPIDKNKYNYPLSHQDEFKNDIMKYYIGEDDLGRRRRYTQLLASYQSTMFKMHNILRYSRYILQFNTNFTDFTAKQHFSHAPIVIRPLFINFYGLGNKQMILRHFLEYYMAQYDNLLFFDGHHLANLTPHQSSNSSKLASQQLDICPTLVNPSWPRWNDQVCVFLEAIHSYLLNSCRLPACKGESPLADVFDVPFTHFTPTSLTRDDLQIHDIDGASLGLKSYTFGLESISQTVQNIPEDTSPNSTTPLHTMYMNYYRDAMHTHETKLMRDHRVLNGFILPSDLKFLFNAVNQYNYVFNTTQDLHRNPLMYVANDGVEMNENGSTNDNNSIILPSYKNNIAEQASFSRLFLDDLNTVFNNAKWANQPQHLRITTLLKAFDNYRIDNGNFDNYLLYRKQVLLHETNAIDYNTILDKFNEAKLVREGKSDVFSSPSAQFMGYVYQDIVNKYNSQMVMDHLMFENAPQPFGVGNMINKHDHSVVITAEKIKLFNKMLDMVMIDEQNPNYCFKPLILMKFPSLSFELYDIKAKFAKQDCSRTYLTYGSSKDPFEKKFAEINNLGINSSSQTQFEERLRLEKELFELLLTVGSKDYLVAQSAFKSNDEGEHIIVPLEQEADDNQHTGNQVQLVKDQAALEQNQIGVSEKAAAKKLAAEEKKTAAAQKKALAVQKRAASKEAKRRPRNDEDDENEDISNNILSARTADINMNDQQVTIVPQSQPKRELQSVIIPQLEDDEEEEPLKSQHYVHMIDSDLEDNSDALAEAEALSQSMSHQPLKNRKKPNLQSTEGSVTWKKRNLSYSDVKHYPKLHQPQRYLTLSDRWLFKISHRASLHRFREDWDPYKSILALEPGSTEFQKATVTRQKEILVNNLLVERAVEIIKNTFNITSEIPHPSTDCNGEQFTETYNAPIIFNIHPQTPNITEFCTATAQIEKPRPAPKKRGKKATNMNDTTSSKADINPPISTNIALNTSQTYPVNASDSDGYSDIEENVKKQTVLRVRETASGVAFKCLDSRIDFWENYPITPAEQQVILTGSTISYPIFDYVDYYKQFHLMIEKYKTLIQSIVCFKHISLIEELHKLIEYPSLFSTKIISTIENEFNTQPNYFYHQSMFSEIEPPTIESTEIYVLLMYRYILLHQRLYAHISHIVECLEQDKLDEIEFTTQQQNYIRKFRFRQSPKWNAISGPTILSQSQQYNQNAANYAFFDDNEKFYSHFESRNMRQLSAYLRPPPLSNDQLLSKIDGDLSQLHNSPFCGGNTIFSTIQKPLATKALVGTNNSSDDDEDISGLSVDSVMNDEVNSLSIPTKASGSLMMDSGKFGQNSLVTMVTSDCDTIPIDQVLYKTALMKRFQYAVEISNFRYELNQIKLLFTKEIRHMMTKKWITQKIQYSTLFMTQPDLLIGRFYTLQRFIYAYNCTINRPNPYLFHSLFLPLIHKSTNNPQLSDNNLFGEWLSHKSGEKNDKLATLSLFAPVTQDKTQNNVNTQTIVLEHAKTVASLVSNLRYDSHILTDISTPKPLFTATAQFTPEQLQNAIDQQLCVKAPLDGYHFKYVLNKSISLALDYQYLMASAKRSLHTFSHYNQLEYYQKSLHTMNALTKLTTGWFMYLPSTSLYDIYSEHQTHRREYDYLQQCYLLFLQYKNNTIDIDEYQQQLKAITLAQPTMENIHTIVQHRVEIDPKTKKFKQCGTAAQYPADHLLFNTIPIVSHKADAKNPIKADINANNVIYRDTLLQETPDTVGDLFIRGIGDAGLQVNQSIHTTISSALYTPENLDITKDDDILLHHQLYSLLGEFNYVENVLRPISPPLQQTMNPEIPSLIVEPTPVGKVPKRAKKVAKKPLFEPTTTKPPEMADTSQLVLDSFDYALDLEQVDLDDLVAELNNNTLNMLQNQGCSDDMLQNNLIILNNNVNNGVMKENEENIVEPTSNSTITVRSITNFPINIELYPQTEINYDINKYLYYNQHNLPIDSSSTTYLSMGDNYSNIFNVIDATADSQRNIYNPFISRTAFIHTNTDRLPLDDKCDKFSPYIFDSEDITSLSHHDKLTQQITTQLDNFTTIHDSLNILTGSFNTISHLDIIESRNVISHYFREFIPSREETAAMDATNYITSPYLLEMEYHSISDAGVSQNCKISPDSYELEPTPLNVVNNHILNQLDITISQNVELKHFYDVQLYSSQQARNPIAGNRKIRQFVLNVVELLLLLNGSHFKSLRQLTEQQREHFQQNYRQILSSFVLNIGISSIDYLLFHNKIISLVLTLIQEFANHTVQLISSSDNIQQHSILSSMMTPNNIVYSADMLKTVNTIHDSSNPHESIATITEFVNNGSLHTQFANPVNTTMAVDCTNGNINNFVHIHTPTYLPFPQSMNQHITLQKKAKNFTKGRKTKGNTVKTSSTTITSSTTLKNTSDSIISSRNLKMNIQNVSWETHRKFPKLLSTIENILASLSKVQNNIFLVLVQAQYNFIVNYKIWYEYKIQQRMDQKQEEIETKRGLKRQGRLVTDKELFEDSTDSDDNEEITAHKKAKKNEKILPKHPIELDQRVTPDSDVEVFIGKYPGLVELDWYQLCKNDMYVRDFDAFRTQIRELIEQGIVVKHQTQFEMNHTTLTKTYGGTFFTVPMTFHFLRKYVKKLQSKESY